MRANRIRKRKRSVAPARPNQHTPQNYFGLFTRLVSNTHEPSNDQACWVWKGPTYKRYPEMTIRMHGQHRKIKPHRAMLCIMECGEDTELFADVYTLFSYAEFDADHLCFANPLCINPDHLQWLTKEEHMLKNMTQVHPDQHYAALARS